MQIISAAGPGRLGRRGAIAPIYSVLSSTFALGDAVTPLLPLSGAPPVLLAFELPVGGQGTVGAEEPGPQAAGLALAPLLAAPPNDPVPCEPPVPCWIGEVPVLWVVGGVADPPDAPLWATAMLPPWIIATAAAAAKRYLRM